MECQDVGSSNADIAGLGIVLSFTIQGGLSFILSVWYAYLDLKYQIVRQPRNIAQWASPETLTLGKFHQVRELKMILIANVLKTVSDAQLLNGISLLIGALVQRNTLSMYHYHIVYDSVNLTGVSAAAAAVVVFRSPVTIIHTLYLILVYVSLYLAYVVLFGIRLSSWDYNIAGSCYHANGITASSSTGELPAHPGDDLAYLLFTAVYLLASVSLCLLPVRKSLLERLENAGITASNGPKVFRLVYILISFLVGPRLFYNLVSGGSWWFIWCLSYIFPILYTQVDRFVKWFAGALRLTITASDSQTGPVSLQIARMQTQVTSLLNLMYQWVGETGLLVLVFAIAQYPVHAYMLFQLRHANEAFLSGDPESSWGFGQVVALVLVAATIIDCIRSLSTFVILVIGRSDGYKSDEWNKKMSLLRSLLVDESIEWPTTTEP